MQRIELLEQYLSKDTNYFRALDWDMDDLRVLVRLKEIVDVLFGKLEWNWPMDKMINCLRDANQVYSQIRRGM